MDYLTHLTRGFDAVFGDHRFDPPNTGEHVDTRSDTAIALDVAQYLETNALSASEILCGYLTKGEEENADVELRKRIVRAIDADFSPESLQALGRLIVERTIRLLAEDSQESR